mmetsp:Transcript_28272/g.31408  ORF Transcript_28272/g.31408 Transcript_28272/m.31408 type:complete len:139 (+) Transcript_28272:3-419(+)
MIEEALYFVLVYYRWQVDEIYYNHVQPEYFGRVSIPLRWLLIYLSRPMVLKSLYGQGMGRFKRAEVAKRGFEMLEAISAYLDDKPYFLGDKPHDIDCTVWSILEALATVPFEYEIKSFILEKTNLKNYLQRLRSEFWS